MFERKRKCCSSLNPGEKVSVKKCSAENIYPLSKRPCFSAQNLVEIEMNFSGQRVENVNFSSYAISNQTHTVMDTSTTGYFPYKDVNYKPRMCIMCAAGDSGHINHILT